MTAAKLCAAYARKGWRVTASSPGEVTLSGPQGRTVRIVDGEREAEVWERTADGWRCAKAYRKARAA